MSINCWKPTFSMLLRSLLVCLTVCSSLIPWKINIVNSRVINISNLIYCSLLFGWIDWIFTISRERHQRPWLIPSWDWVLLVSMPRVNSFMSFLYQGKRLYLAWVWKSSWDSWVISLILVSWQFLSLASCWCHWELFELYFSQFIEFSSFLFSCFSNLLDS